MILGHRGTRLILHHDSVKGVAEIKLETCHDVQVTRKPQVSNYAVFLVLENGLDPFLQGHQCETRYGPHAGADQDTILVDHKKRKRNKV